MLNSYLSKYAIYSEGFRGVPDGWHTLRACNFLVGENSTGKSSFLQLIQLLDDPGPFFNFDITGIVSGLDTHHDILSRSTGAKRLTIGFVAIQSQEARQAASEPEEQTPTGTLSTYSLKKGKLALSHQSTLSSKYITRFKRTEKGIRYKIEELDFPSDSRTSDIGNHLVEYHHRGDRSGKFTEVDWSKSSSGSAWLRTQIIALTETPSHAQESLLRGQIKTLDVRHHGPIRAQAVRWYHGDQKSFSDSGEHAPYVIKRITEGNSKLKKSIERFGRDSGLFDSISVTKMKTQVGDEPFALQFKKADKHYYIDELGFGLGQILPIIADVLLAHPSVTFLIEQPEVHLHPKAQAALGDLFFNVVNTGRALVVETHSDYLIDRFRMLQKSAKQPPRAQIRFFWTGKDGVNESSEIELNPDGSLENPPAGYREFFVKEGIKTLELD